MANLPLYEPLDTARDEFRLLSLAPNADPSSDIACRLYTVGLVDEPSYTALSYVWGDPTITKPILLDGIEVQVTVNLEGALRRIRQAQAEVITWVDALCINQHDVHERNAQVAMMGRLYSKTRLVYAWLGDDDDESAAYVFEFISKFSRHFRAEVENVDNFFRDFRQRLSTDSFRQAINSVVEDFRTGGLTMSEHLWKGIQTLTFKPYWYRAWIQQELILPPKVLLLCGEVSMPLSVFVVWRLSMNISEIRQCLISSLPDSSIRTSHPIDMPLVIGAVFSNRENLASIFGSFAGCQTTVSHDSIYGLLGIYTGSRSIPIDYGKPATLVFGEVVRILAEGDGQLYLRTKPRDPDLPPLHNLPSWTPDFRFNEFNKYTPRLEGKTWYRPKIDSTSNAYLFRTYGWIVDTVKSVTPFESRPTKSIANSRIFWAFLRNNITTPHPTGFYFLQALYCNIFERQKSSGFANPYDLADLRSFLQWINFMYTAEDDDDIPYGSHPRSEKLLKEYGLENLFQSLDTLPDEIALSLRFAIHTGAVDHLIEPYRGAQDHSAFLHMTAQQRMAPFWGREQLPVEFLEDVEWHVEHEFHHVRHFLERLQYRSSETLIVTEQGYTGITTPDVSIGDSICLLAGCHHPKLIRPSGEFYEVVGGSFIFGLMDNELFKNGSLTEDNQQMFDFI